MNIAIKRERYSAKLPATPCTPSMREIVQTVAQKEGVTLAELQRFAIDFFLQNYDRKTVNDWQENSRELLIGEEQP